MARRPVAGAAGGSPARQKQDFTRAVATWWQAVQRNVARSKTPAPVPGRGAGRPVVTVDVAAVASHHPAWKLADALERGHGVTLNAMEIAALHNVAIEPLPALPPVATPATPGRARVTPSDAVAPDVVAPGAVAPGAVAPVDFQLKLPRRQVTADEGTEQLDQARARQERALQDFLDDLTARQAQARGDRSALMQAALTEEIDVARHSALPPLEPVLPSEADQTEMMNLRLQLMRNVFITEADREALRARLKVLEDRWHQRLMEQEKQRLAEIAEQHEAVPRRLDVAGEQRIKSDLKALENHDDAVRGAAADELRERIAIDFGTLSLLSITQPSLEIGPRAVIPALAGGAANVSPRTLSQMVNAPTASNFARLLQPTIMQQNRLEAEISRAIHRTIGTAPSSVKSNAGLPESYRSSSRGVTALRNHRATVIRALRMAALRDARRWVAVAVRRSGWQLRELSRVTNAGLPDRTREVLKILKLS